MRTVVKNLCKQPVILNLRHCTFFTPMAGFLLGELVLHSLKLYFGCLRPQVLWLCSYSSLWFVLDVERCNIGLILPFGWWSRIFNPLSKKNCCKISWTMHIADQSPRTAACAVELEPSKCSIYRYGSGMLAPHKHFRLIVLSFEFVCNECVFLVCSKMCYQNVWALKFRRRGGWSWCTSLGTLYKNCKNIGTRELN